MAVTPSAQYSVTIRVAIDAGRPGLLGELAGAIGTVGGDIGAIDVVEATTTKVVRELVVDASDLDHAAAIVAAAGSVDGVEVDSSDDRTFRMHHGGNIETATRLPWSRATTSRSSTPPASRASAWRSTTTRRRRLTIKRNTVAVVTDGTAVLGLGDIGPAAAMPVMEGKSMLFKAFGGVDAWPICLDTKDPDEIVAIVKAIAPGFGGINLEDISAPRCFDIEERLKKELDIPVFHDDQHGTAVVVLAALLNALRIVKKEPADLKAVVLGVGAAGVACAKMIMAGRGDEHCGMRPLWHHLQGPPRAHELREGMVR